MSYIENFIKPCERCGEFEELRIELSEYTDIAYTAKVVCPRCGLEGPASDPDIDIRIVKLDARIKWNEYYT